MNSHAKLLMDQPFDFTKIIVAILVTALFIWCDIDPFNHSFVHMINFPIHEVGHILFMYFGQFIFVAGGTSFQLLVPILCFIDFWRRGEFFSAFIILMWLGNNFFDVAVYARDAIFRELPLANLFGSIDSTHHDWYYLLTTTGMLAHTDLIANIIVGFGVITTLIAIIGTFYFARKSAPADY